jgi:hypothetical protein
MSAPVDPSAPNLTLDQMQTMVDVLNAPGDHLRYRQAAPRRPRSPKTREPIEDDELFDIGRSRLAVGLIRAWRWAA